MVSGSEPRSRHCCPRAPHRLLLEGTSPGPAPLFGDTCWSLGPCFPAQAERANTSLPAVLNPSAAGGWEEWVFCQLPWCGGLDLGPGQIYSYSDFSFFFFPCCFVGWVMIDRESHLVSFTSLTGSMCFRNRAGSVSAFP